MYSAKLSEPRRKKRRRDVVPQQTLPIPIASLTGIEADNANWRWYEGTLVRNVVEVSTDPQAIKILSTMGFFGEIKKSGNNRDVDKFVSVEDFDPILTPCDEDTLSELIGKNATNVAVDQNETSSSSENDDIVEETPTVDKRQGWGKWKKENIAKDVLVLESYEAFFLAYGLGCLRVKSLTSPDDVMTIDDLWRHFSQCDANFRYRYVAYHHFRSKNWVVRNGTKFGNDFLLYKEGPPFYHASYSVRVQTDRSDGINLTWSELSALNRVTESAAKELLILEVSESCPKINADSLVTEYLDNVNVKEVLVRRWVAAQKREDD
jgi:tRNA-intron lyase